MLEVREVYFMGDYDAYPRHVRFERGVIDPPRCGWARVIVIPRDGGKAVIVDPSSLDSYEVSASCEELATSKPTEGSPAITIKRLCRNLVERDKLKLPISRPGLEALKSCGVELPEVRVLAEPVEERAEKTPKASSKPKREGLVSVAAIAAELDVSPKEARASLRRANESKPEAGWAFSGADVERIKRVITDNLK